MGEAPWREQELLQELRRRRWVQPASELLPGERGADATCRVSTGLGELDRLCGGGLRRGSISEIRTCGSPGALLQYALLAAAGERGELSALVDAEDGFDPRSARAAGVELARVLWVRPPGWREALRATELVLETGGFGLLILDWGGGARARSVPEAAWVRLGRLLRETGSVLVNLSPGASAGSFAGLSLEVSACRPRWRQAGGPGGPGFIEGFELGFRLQRRRGGRGP